MIAILRAEPAAETYALTLAGDTAPPMSVANYCADQPLLFEGDDFGHTDVTRAVPTG